MNSKILITVALVSSLFAREAYACKCALPPPAKEALAESDAVFSGKVIEVERNGRGKVVTIEVDRAWKGMDAKQAVVSTEADSAACGFPFEKGKGYLVYCRRDEKKLSTNLCTRTKSIDVASEDLKELDEGKR